MKALVVSDGQHELGGALQTLIRRIAPFPLEFDELPVRWKDLQPLHGKGRGYFKRAVRWMLHAESQGYDALILVIDEDGNAERIREIADAQDHHLGIRRRALGIAIHMFDAWMIADEKALSDALGLPIQRQPQPESVTDPKDVFKSLRDRSSTSDDLPTLYSAIATTLDLHVLESRCPKGFRVFANRLRSL